MWVRRLMFCEVRLTKCVWVSKKILKSPVQLWKKLKRNRNLWSSHSFMFVYVVVRVSDLSTSYYHIFQKLQFIKKSIYLYPNPLTPFNLWKSIIICETDDAYSQPQKPPPKTVPQVRRSNSTQQKKIIHTEKKVVNINCQRLLIHYFDNYGV